MIFVAARPALQFSAVAPEWMYRRLDVYYSPFPTLRRDLCHEQKSIIHPVSSLCDAAERL